MPHAARAGPAQAVQGPGLQRPGPLKMFVPLTKQRRANKSTRPACSLITTPVLTELMKLTLSTSSVTNTNTIAAGKSSCFTPCATPVSPRRLTPSSILCSIASCWPKLSGLVQHIVRIHGFSGNMGCTPDQLSLAQPF